MSGAQAADLPVKAKAVEYVKICSLYGAGFYYIPGTDTCIKLGGYLRVDNGCELERRIHLETIRPRPTSRVVMEIGSRTLSIWRSREDLNIDTRTATEYGVVRTFFDATFTWTDDNYTASPNGSNALGSVYSQCWVRLASVPALVLANAGNATSGGGRYRCSRRLLRVHPVRWLHDG